MTGPVTVIPAQRRLSGPGWSLRAERVELLGPGGWRALLGIRRGLRLLVTQAAGQPGLRVEAWAGEPGRSAGVAVIEAADGTPQLARVPLCRCGERGCGNVGIQLDKELDDGELPALADLLRDLPWATTVPDRTNVLRGQGLAALSR
ncbi:MAG TPA: hypothetical protein VK586_16300 [Streptosporangiaceae bacterium]|nr:hypothetical protein [Streptosporangiaceae bacterium]